MNNRLQTTEDMAIGSDVFYAGDVVNASWWGTVTGIHANAYGVEHHYEGDEAAPLMVTILLPHQIGTVYQGHCDPRYVTGDAYRTWEKNCIAECASPCRCQCGRCARRIPHQGEGHPTCECGFALNVPGAVQFCLTAIKAMSDAEWQVHTDAYQQLSRI